MTESSELAPRDVRSAVVRIAVTTALALAFSLGVYLLLEAVRPRGGLISFSFLLVLPAAVSAFVSYVADPWAERRLWTYLLIPLWIGLAAIAAAAVFLRESVICILLLTPLWLASGMLGSGLTYAVRRRLKRGRVYCTAVVLAPLAMMGVEPALPPPGAEAVVTRSVVIDAAPARLWPLLRGIPDVHPGEGRWNLTQDVIGLPRPLGARLVGEGVGAERLAGWGAHIHFRERVVGWAPGRSLGWRFIFDDPAAWDVTDSHLRPDSPYFRITTGGYTMTPAGPGRTRLTLATHYWIRTPVNAYAQAWGELFIGDLETNLLALVKGRAAPARA